MRYLSSFLTCCVWYTTVPCSPPPSLQLWHEYWLRDSGYGAIGCSETHQTGKHMLFIISICCEIRRNSTFLRSMFIHSTWMSARLCWILEISVKYSPHLKAVLSFGENPARNRQGGLQGSGCGSIASLCLTLCDPKDSSMPGFSVPHHLPEFAQVQVQWISDAIQPSHPLSPSFPSVFNLSQYQGLFQWVSCSHQVAKVLELQLQLQSFQRVFRVDFL